MPIYKTYSPIIVFNVPTLEQNFKEFVVEIREENDDTTLVTKTSGGVQDLKGTWWMNPVLFEHTVKGVVYEHRTFVRDTNGNISSDKGWVTETAGDTSFGSTDWTGTALSTTAHSIVVAITLVSPPIDFDRIEIYVKTSSGLTDPNASWDNDYKLDSPTFEYYWSAQREVTKYIYCRAFDQSGNFSALNEIGSAQIPRIDWKNDLDNVAPDNSSISGNLEAA